MNPETLKAAGELIEKAMAARQKLAMSVSDFKPLNKNTVRGVFTLVLPSGMKINGCLLHQRDDCGYWVGTPSIPREIAGKKVWAKVIEFDSKATHEKFQAAAVTAVAKHLNGGRQ